MVDTFEGLRQAIVDTGKSYDLAEITKAYELASEAHGTQTRRSGEPYITHPVATAYILVELGMDTESIVAALLHDVVEDTPISEAEIKRSFGKEVALLVSGVTKVGRIPFSSREEQQAENVRKMLLAMAQDVRVIIIKLADRLHNMRTIDSMPKQKQRDISLETMEIYAPLAHRLGMKGVKEELEDRSLKILDPVAHDELEKQLKLREQERHDFLTQITERITARLEAEDHHYSIAGRVKSYYGIYRKVYMQGRAFDEIFDIYAVRIIVDTDIECYNVLGVVHDMFTPIPNRFKDYISTPKQNLYQSLHTTVLDKEGIPFEIQIRTWDMHYTAEYGIAAHWKYKAGVADKSGGRLEERLAWIRRLLDVQQESEGAEDILRSIKTDIAPEEVFVFTPKGDVIRLPIGSTVVDFAYAIHSAVGNRMVGAKVDGRMVSLDYEVKTGMIVEVLTSNAKEGGPNRDWLKMVKTSEARNKIRTWFKREKRDENIATGREELHREFRRNFINLTAEQEAVFLADLAKRQSMQSVEDFYAAIGWGGISLSRIMPRIKDDYRRLYVTKERPDDVENIIQKSNQRERKASGGVIVEGLEGCLVKFAKCCNPLPGDDITGFVTRGYGVSIHKRDCTNILIALNEPEQAERLVDAEWAGSASRSTFKSTIDIFATDRTGLIADISIILNNMHIPIHALNAREARGGTSIQMTLSILDVGQLQNIITNLRKVEGVYSVERTTA